MSERAGGAWAIPAVIVAALAIAVSAWGAWTFAEDTAAGKPWRWGTAATGLGYDFWLAVGGVLWALGTALFVMEVAFSRTIRGGKITAQRIAWDAIDVATAALCAAVYGGGLLATTGMVVIPGFTWIRPANMLSPIFGMLFGIPGCVGCAVGNLIADSLGGYLGVGSIGGFVGNFILSYVPYKLMKDHSMRTPRSWLEYYLWGVLVGSAWCAVYISWWLHVAMPLIGLPPEFIWGFFCPFVFINNALITAVVGGVLAYILFSMVKRWGLYWSDRISFE